MESLARLWWLFVLRGVLAIAFGVIALLAPGEALLAIALWFGAYAFVDGIFSIAAAVTGHAPGGRWGSLLVVGLLGLAVGVFTFVNPWLTEVALLYVIAFWAVATGVFEVIAAVRLRRYIEGEWLLAVSGVLSIIFGLVLVAMPLIGMLAVAWLVGSYAVVFGACGSGWACNFAAWAGMCRCSAGRDCGSVPVEGNHRWVAKSSLLGPFRNAYNAAIMYTCTDPAGTQPCQLLEKVDS